MSGDGSSTVSRELWKTMLMVRNTNTRRIRAPMLERETRKQAKYQTDVRQLLGTTVIDEQCHMCWLVSLNVETVSFHVTHNYTNTH